VQDEISEGIAAALNATFFPANGDVEGHNGGEFADGGGQAA